MKYAYLALSIAIIPFCWTIPQAYYEVQGFDFSYVESFERTVVEEPPVEVRNEIDEAMLNWVIMCESSGNHRGVWGAEDKYGILQFKQKSFYWLAEKYNFVGDWKNEDDQIALFLLTSEDDKYQHWTCVRKFKQTTKL